MCGGCGGRARCGPQPGWNGGSPVAPVRYDIALSLDYAEQTVAGVVRLTVRNVTDEPVAEDELADRYR